MGQRVGVLSSVQGVLSFAYLPDYWQQEKAVKISTSFPLQDGPFDHQTTQAFFSGLLPDDYVRKRLARYLGLSERNVFSLLAEIGGECAGAISLYSPGKSPRDDVAPTYRILENEEAHDILSQLDKRPMMAGEEDIRISGAGAQDKLLVAIMDGKIAIPTGSTPSTHIIKPPIRGLQDSVHNEFFCMKLAKMMGFLVPDVEIYWLAGEPYYLVNRYDRHKNTDGFVTRLHQEDFCQALHIPPEQKYENEGGPSVATCFALLEERIRLGVMPGQDKIRLLQAILFNFLIGNGDAHGKNFSLLYAGAGERFAPLYDLLSTIIYGNAFKAKMAMKIGGKYKFQEIGPRQIEVLATISGIHKNFIDKQVKGLSTKIRPYAQSLMEQLNSSPQTASPIYEQIFHVIEKHTHQLKTVTAEMI